ncbi:hypothetical protein I317_02265 [Kwoniella heveanensis CBS 569]|uniref:Phospholipid scramblase n=1 Tax=Kwoniella heveanensis BCC8398 TaxID=1296120 RepID=A0A1B9GW27_9TREE|nr:hypothetical protein I316_03262 [Kwoniella heveanensis BCC8398]OCF43823.1 hypothetical protein I317_02265 [Kwoniella heveanensis CBS 569]
MLRRATTHAWPALQAAAGPSRQLLLPARQRAISTALPLLRQDDRLPRGHIRPRRRPIHPSEQAQAADQPNQTGPGAGPGPYPQYDFDQYDPSTLQGGQPPIPSRPISIPPDPHGVLGDSHAARDILGHESLVIVRQLEMLNVFMGFEQANRYAIHSPDGQHVGFLAEEEQSFLSAISRQALRTHRPFRAVVMDRYGKPVLWIRRPFAFINSRIFVHATEGPEGTLVGETQQQWHPWRRRYNVFQTRDAETFKQFARVDSGFLAWDFWLKDRDDRLVASINRNFRGLGRELFTDTGQYVIRFDAAGTELNMPPGSEINVQGQSLILPRGKEGGLTLDQRAMTLATAVSIDFDYFSRHSGSGGLGFPFVFWGGGDGGMEASRGGSAGTQPIDGGAAAGAAAGAAGAAGSGTGVSEDEQIYGRQPRSAEEDGGQYPEQQSRNEYGDEGLEGYEEEQGWGEDEVMQDPWSQQQQGGDGGGWFGGDGGGDWGGGGGDWGS